MADISKTLANVSIGEEGVQFVIGQAGASVSQGEPVYLASGDGKYYKTDANDGVAKAAAVGIALLPAATNGYFLIQTAGLINLGATLVQGTSYYVSTTAGGICLESDLASGNFTTFLGIATSTSLLELDITVSGVARA
jgi:hypothetical protein